MTRIFRSRNSSRTHCKNPSSANLLMQYALQLAKPLLAATERMFTTLEPGGILGARCCVNMKGAVILTPTVCSHSICVISPNGFTTATPALFTRKSIIRRFPQAQPDQPLPKTSVYLRPKRTYNIFPGGRHISKILRFQIEMSILPGLKRLFDRFPKRNKVVDRTAARIVIASDSR